MIYALVLLLTALAVATGLICQLMVTLYDANRRIDRLQGATVRYQQRITTLTERNGDLEDRNACLERIQRKNLHASIVSLPVMDGPCALGRGTEITLN